MNHDTPSKTARKVALNILALGEKPEMSGVLPPGIVDATGALLVASKATGEKVVQWSRSSWMTRLYEAFDWMMPGQLDGFLDRSGWTRAPELVGRYTKTGIEHYAVATK